jgi:hypothetical protein
MVERSLAARHAFEIEDFFNYIRKIAANQEKCSEKAPQTRRNREGAEMEIRRGAEKRICHSGIPSGLHEA